MLLITVQWTYESNDDGEVSVSKGEAVGVMEKKPSDPDDMCRVSMFIIIIIIMRDQAYLFCPHQYIFITAVHLV